MKKITQNNLYLQYKHTSFGVAVIDKSDRLVYINPFLSEIIGLNEIIFPRNSFHEFISLKQVELYLNFKNNFIKKDKNRDSNTSILLLNKELKEVPFQLSMGEENKDPTSNLVLFLIPANIKVQQKNDSGKIDWNNTFNCDTPLSEEFLCKDLLSKIWNNSEDLLFILDKNGFIKYLNPVAESKIGYNLSEIQTNQSHIFVFEEKHTYRFSRKSPPPPKLANDKLSIKNNLEYLEKRTEILLIKKDGSKCPIAFAAFRIPSDENLQEYHYLGIAQILENENTLRQELFKQRKLFIDQARFISTASHELRTPLNIILSSATLISKYIELNQTEYINLHTDRILSTVQLITSLLNDFMIVRKIEEDKVKINLCYFNIQSHIMLTISELKYLLKEQQEIYYEHLGDVSICLDPKLIKHIVINLISNAIKYSNDDGKIEIMSIQHNRSLELIFKDNGIGISKADQQHLFERFFRGANALNTKGTGLGLNIVYNYVKLMKGNLFVESELEKGTTFKIVFPC